MKDFDTMSKEQLVFYYLASFALRDALKQFFEQLFPPPPKVYLQIVHPVWQRGSLVCHQPIQDGEQHIRVGHVELGDDRVFEEA